MASKKEVPARTCGQCIHEWACSMQCGGNPMAQGNAMHCACYEDVKSSTAYFIGTLDGAKGNIPDRLRELAVADKDGRVIVLPCKVGEPAYWVHNGIITDCRINRIQVNRKGVFLCLKSTKAHGAFRVDACLGETVFLTREEAEKALAELEGKKDG